MITLTPSNTHPNTYSLNWQAQQSHTILEGLKNLIGQDDLMTDCTLASADGEYVQCHKLILTLCSAFFKDLFQRNRADKANTIIILGNVTAQNLKYLLQFMYQGKVDIPSKDVDSFLQAGNNLKIEGLIGNVGNDGESPPPHNSNSYSSQSQSQNQSGVSQPSRPVRTFPSSVSHNQSNKYATPQEAPSHSHIPLTSDPTPNKRARLTETSCSGSNSTAIVPIGQLHVSNPVIVGEPVTHGVSTIQAATNSEPDLDPLNDASAPEQAIDFNPMKTEPIQVYHGYEDEGDDDNNQSDMTHREGEEDEEEMYEGSNEDSYEIPQSALVSVSAPPPVAVPGSSAGSQLSVRPRGNLPDTPSKQSMEVIFQSQSVGSRIREQQNSAEASTNDHHLTPYHESTSGSVVIDASHGSGGGPSAKTSLPWCTRRAPSAFETRPVPAKTRSKVYNFFNWDESIRQWRCKICERSYTHNRKGGSASLLNHMHRHHPDVAKLNFGERKPIS